MKKVIGIIVVILLIGGGLTITNRTTLLKLGTTRYYVKTTKDYKDISNKNEGHYTQYEYNIKGYDEEGNEKIVTFTTNKVLKVDRYLEVAEKNDEVKAYEEVSIGDLPEKVKEIYNVK